MKYFLVFFALFTSSCLLAEEPVQYASRIVSQGERCNESGVRCEAGSVCMGFMHISNLKMQFKACQIPCKEDSDCPGSQRCGSISDGRHSVCFKVRPGQKILR
ncbi:hypothetical protein JNK13_06815 [bacterium]|nr:hypothetical protein [bacterium]